MNSLFWMNDFLSRDASACVLQCSRHVFDSAVWHLFWPLINGGRAVIPVRDLFADRSYLFELIDKHQISLVDFVPSVLEAILGQTPSNEERRLTSLRWVIVGGEESKWPTLHKLRQITPQARIVNVYGPTEASVGASYTKSRQSS